jgi:hypothetical protein
VKSDIAGTDIAHVHIGVRSDRLVVDKDSQGGAIIIQANADNFAFPEPNAKRFHVCLSQPHGVDLHFDPAAADVIGI